MHYVCNGKFVYFFALILNMWTVHVICRYIEFFTASTIRGWSNDSIRGDLDNHSNQLRRQFVLPPLPIQKTAVSKRPHHHSSSVCCRLGVHCLCYDNWWVHLQYLILAVLVFISVLFKATSNFRGYRRWLQIIYNDHHQGYRLVLSFQTLPYKAGWYLN